MGHPNLQLVYLSVTNIVNKVNSYSIHGPLFTWHKVYPSRVSWYQKGFALCVFRSPVVSKSTLYH